MHSLDNMFPPACPTPAGGPHSGAFSCWQVFCTQAHHAWQHEKVRRLPVVKADGRLQGMLCLNDMALRAEEARGKPVPDLSYDEALGTRTALGKHRAAHVAAHA